MENVAQNVVVNEAVKAVKEVKAVKTNNTKKEDKTMEKTNTAVENTAVTTNLTFEVVRNSHDALDVKFSEKPCREILMRMNEGFTKRSERFNWFNGVWSTFRFNTSKETTREGKEAEIEQCKMFIEKIISEPLTMSDEEAQALYKEKRAEAKTSKAEKKPTTKKATTKKASAKKVETKKAEPKTKKEEAKELNEKVNAYLKTLGMKREDFNKLPKEAKQLILAGMPE